MSPLGDARERWLPAARAIATRALGPGMLCAVAVVPEGVSTAVYRVRRGAETYYLRVLPEVAASFAPEVLVHRTLRAVGVRVPEVLHYEPRDPLTGRSVMLTTAVPGRSVASAGPGPATRDVLIAAGRDLARVNALPVEGFGWVRRDRAEVTRLEGERPTLRAFAREHLEADLALLAGHGVSPGEVARVRAVVADHDGWLDEPRGCLAHGDLDATHVYQDGDRYAGIIDFGEIRGAGRWYDLGHYRMYDGELLPALTLPWLLAGYAEVAPLRPDAERRIALWSLLIGVRALGRALERRPPTLGRHHRRILAGIPHDLALLG